MDKTYIGYARVSTMEQNETRQLHSFEGYTEKIKKVFIDKLSGKNTDRPQLQAMLSYVREGDVVVISDFSRLARSTRDMLHDRSGTDRQESWTYQPERECGHRYSTGTFHAHSVCCSSRA